MKKKLLEKFDSIIIISNYLMRNTCLIFIKYFIEKKLIYYVYKLSKDKISNIRMNCAFILNKVKNSDFDDRSHKDKIKKIIDVLKTDEDKDVCNIFDIN